jgi:hypothetical protein
LGRPAGDAAVAGRWGGSPARANESLTHLWASEGACGGGLRRAMVGGIVLVLIGLGVIVYRLTKTVADAVNTVASAPAHGRATQDPTGPAARIAR